MNVNVSQRSLLFYLLFGLTALAGILAAANLISTIGQPFGGFYAGHSRTNPQWTVDAATPPWWLPLAQRQLFHSDILVAVDGHTYDNRVGQYFQSAQREGRSTVVVTFIRNGNLLTTPIHLQLFTLGNFIDLKLPDLINGLGFWILAVTVFAAQPYNQVNRVFGATASLIAGSIWLSINGLFKETPGATQWLNLAWVPCASFVGVTIAHLAMLYPQPFHHRQRRIIWLGYGASLLLAITYTIAFGLFLYDFNDNWILTICAVGNVMVIGGFGTGVVIFLARYLYLMAVPNLSRRIRRQVIFLLLGVALTLPYIGVIVLRGVFNSQQDYFALGLDLRYLALATPIAFAYLILRYQTLQRINPAVAGVFVLASSALVASLTAWLMRLLEPEWENTLNVSPFAALFFVTILTAGFYSFQNTLRGTFSKVFQWEFRGYTAVRKFTQQIIARPEKAALPITITQALVEKLELEWVGLWVINETGTQLHLEAQSGKWQFAPPEEIPLGPETLVTFVQPIHLETHQATGSKWLEALTDTGALEVVAPLIVNNNLVGMLGLGKRWDEDIFDDRDLDIIELTAQEIALFILTARQIEELRQVPLQITAAQERERFKLAQELHDTVQQFLGRLPFYLQVGQRNARSNPDETEAILQRTIVEVESASQTVRQIRSNLAPFQLEASLLTPLQELIQQFRTRTGIDVQTHFQSAADAALAIDARHAIYRVIQQALDNADTHAQASQVVLTLQMQTDQLHFSIEDNGKGVPPEAIKKAQTDGSFGLVSMRARITSLGGEFTFKSSPNAGARVYGWLPVAG